MGEFDNMPAVAVVGLDGSVFRVAVNDTPTVGYVTSWKFFTYTFIATGEITTVSFLNGSEADALVNGLDEVTVTRAGDLE